MSRWRGTAAGLAAAVVLVSAPPAQAGEPEPLATLGDPRLTESSGLAVSSRHDGVLWTINDSGGGPHVYAVGDDGRMRARVTLRQVEAYDWEALAPGPDHTLWIGDIGDNQRRRDVIRVHVIAEPVRLRSTDVTARTYRLRYPDGPHDAEAILVHPDSGALLVVTKEARGAGVYAPTDRLHTDEVTTLVKVADAPSLVTDGAYAPDGSRFALRDYLSATLFTQPGRPIRSVPLPLQPQGESLAWAADGRALLSGSEGVGSVIWRVPVSAGDEEAVGTALTPSATPTPSPQRSVTPALGVGREPAGGHLPAWTLLAAALGAAGLAVAATRRRVRDARGGETRRSG